MRLRTRVALFLVVVLISGVRVASIWHAPTHKIERDVWIMYEGIFGIPSIDGKWSGWSYVYDNTADKYFNAPEELPSILYPQNGPYSCHDVTTIEKHVSLIASMGINGIIVPWYGKHGNHSVTQESAEFVDVTMSMLLDTCEKMRLGVNVGVELPRHNMRNTETVRSDIEHFFSTYATHPRILKREGRPVIVVREADGIHNMSLVIRDFPGFYVAGFSLLPEFGAAVENSFDAVSTTWPSAAYRWSTSLSQWRDMRDVSSRRFVEFVPVVAPGYNDSATRRWHDKTSWRRRDNGKYYATMWNAALAAEPNIIIINSFNDWHRGTNIEPSMSVAGYEHTDDSWTTEEVGDDDGRFYVRLTQQFVDAFK